MAVTIVVARAAVLQKHWSKVHDWIYFGTKCKGNYQGLKNRESQYSENNYLMQGKIVELKNEINVKSRFDYYVLDVMT